MNDTQRAEMQRALLDFYGRQLQGLGNFIKEKFPADYDNWGLPGEHLFECIGELLDRLHRLEN